MRITLYCRVERRWRRLAIDTELVVIGDMYTTRYGRWLLSNGLSLVDFITNRSDLKYQKMPEGRCHQFTAADSPGIASSFRISVARVWGASTGRKGRTK